MVNLNEAFKTKKPVMIGIIAALVILVLLIGAFVVTYMGYSKELDRDYIYSGVKFGEIDLSEKTKEEALKIIEEVSISENNEITAMFANQKITFSPVAVGFNYDKNAIVETAHSIGRQGSKLARIKTLMQIKTKGYEVEPTYLTDEELFITTIETLIKELNINTKPFDVKYEGNYAHIKINDLKEEPNYKEFYNQILNKVSQDDYSDINMPTKESNEITSQSIYDEIYIESKNAKSQVVNGKTVILPHVVGINVKKEDIEKELSAGKKEFKVKITKTYPQIRTENVEGGLFNDVLGTFSTNYNAGIVGRTKNVSLAASKINNTVLNSGDIFSFNKVVGKRTTAAGFSTAIIFTNGELQEELGGGICQVSSTLYNSVLYADLKIVERRNHMFTVSYAKNGLDATVAYGSIDFRFKNSMESPIKIVANASGGVLRISILGKKQNNNKVYLSAQTIATTPFETKEVPSTALEMGKKKVKQNGQNGYKVNAYKTVKDANGTVIRTEFLGTSVYSPLVKIVEVGADANGNIPGEITGSPSTSPSATPTSSPVATPSPTPIVTPTPTATPAPTIESTPTSKPPEGKETPKPSAETY